VPVEPDFQIGRVAGLRVGDQHFEGVSRRWEQQHGALLGRLGHLEGQRARDGAAHGQPAQIGRDVLQRQGAQLAGPQAGVEGQRHGSLVDRVQATLVEQRTVLRMGERIRVLVALGEARAVLGQAFAILVVLAPVEEADEGGEVVIDGRNGPGRNQVHAHLLDVGGHQRIDLPVAADRVQTGIERHFVAGLGFLGDVDGFQRHVAVIEIAKALAFLGGGVRGTRVREEIGFVVGAGPERVQRGAAQARRVAQVDLRGLDAQRMAMARALVHEVHTHRLPVYPDTRKACLDR
jgi:hypothetical protein